MRKVLYNCLNLIGHPMKKPQIPRMHLSRKTVIRVACVTLLVGAAFGGYLWYRHQTNPETLFWKNMNEEMSQEMISEEKGSGRGTEIDFIGIASKDGTYKSSGTFACKADLPDQGQLQMDISTRQIDQKSFMNHTAFKVSGLADKETEKHLNDSFATLVNKWVIMNDREPAAQINDEHGIIFGIGGATPTSSKKFTAKQLTNLGRKHNLVRIDKITTESFENRRVWQYTVSMQRDNYARFIDEVIPDLVQKEALLDSLFQEETETVKMVVDQETKELKYVSYEIPNPCLDILGELDPALEASFSKRIEIRNTESKNDAPKQLTEPTDYINLLEYWNLWSQIDLEQTDEER